MKPRFLIGVMGHVYVNILMALIEVEKFMAAVIGGLEALVEGCIGCDEDCVPGVW